MSHKFHPLRRTSRLIGRCLSLLLREFHVAFPLWGSPSMIVSRDMHFLMRSHCPHSLSLWERDIDNAFWNLDKDKVLQGIKQACTVVKSYRKIRGDVFFSIAKGNLKSLDRMGKAAARHFRVVSSAELLSFVEWDMNQNNLFTLWGIVLRQQVKGVPIGGFLSAQLMCLCLLAVEYNFVHSPDRIAVLRPILDNWSPDLPPISLTPGPSLTFPFVSIVPHDPHHFNKNGMSGWFQQDATCLFKLKVGDQTIPVVCIELWDSHPEGRVGKIIDKSVVRQRHFLRGYFSTFMPLHCMVAEVLESPAPSPDAVILLSRYMDNNYIGVINVSPCHLDAVRTFLASFYSVLYDLPMKWEPEGDTVSWCEASLSTDSSLTLKGVPHTPLGPEDVCEMWHRWPDRWSPNCRVVLQSMLPSIIRKSIIFCSSPRERLLNLEAVVQGCGFKLYPWAWWWMPLRVRLKDLGLLTSVPMHLVKIWYQKGVSKGGLGRASM